MAAARKPAVKSSSQLLHCFISDKAVVPDRASRAQQCEEACFSRCSCSPARCCARRWQQIQLSRLRVVAEDRLQVNRGAAGSVPQVRAASCCCGCCCQLHAQLHAPSAAHTLNVAAGTFSAGGSATRCQPCRGGFSSTRGAGRCNGERSDGMPSAALHCSRQPLTHSLGLLAACKAGFGGPSCSACKAGMFSKGGLSAQQNGCGPCPVVKLMECWTSSPCLPDKGLIISPQPAGTPCRNNKGTCSGNGTCGACALPPARQPCLATCSSTQPRPPLLLLHAVCLPGHGGWNCDACGPNSWSPGLPQAQNCTPCPSQPACKKARGPCEQAPPCDNEGRPLDTCWVSAPDGTDCSPTPGGDSSQHWCQRSECIPKSEGPNDTCELLGLGRLRGAAAAHCGRVHVLATLLTSLLRCRLPPPCCRCNSVPARYGRPGLHAVLRWLLERGCAYGNALPGVPPAGALPPHGNALRARPAMRQGHRQADRNVLCASAAGRAMQPQRPDVAAAAGLFVCGRQLREGLNGALAGATCGRPAAMQPHAYKNMHGSDAVTPSSRCMNASSRANKGLREHWGLARQAHCCIVRAARFSGRVQAVKVMQMREAAAARGLFTASELQDDRQP